MTVPTMDDLDDTGEDAFTLEQMASVSDPSTIQPTIENPYPKAMISLSKEKLDAFNIWVSQWLDSLISSHGAKQREWADEEIAYNAEKPKFLAFEPFEGSCKDVVSLIAMAVDPIQARLSIGMFKQDTMYKIKALRTDFLKYTPSLEVFVDFFQKHILKLRGVSEPRLFEYCKHGHMVFNVEYDRETYDVKTYDKTDSWKVVKRPVIRSAGPKVRGVHIGNFLYPPFYEHLQDCPIVFEKQMLLWDELKIAKASGKITNLDKIEGQSTDARSELENEQSKSANLQQSYPSKFYYEVFRGACDYDIDGDGIPEKLIFYYHRGQSTFLQLRYNWYFHQKKPYVLIPYSKASGTLGGLGIAKMTKPMQDALTAWERHAQNNAYLANIRMWAIDKNAGIENRPKMYAGRTFRLNDPQKDMRELRLSDIYPSTLSERQNQIGLAEKRNGVSDYLTGRESPIIGSRATATSTVALIQEGTRRVEQTMENLREGYCEILEMCFYIWIQYGLDGLDEAAFGDDQITRDVKDFFNMVSAENMNGAFALDLAATDSTNNKAIQQQMKMSLMQTLMGYYSKLIETAQMALTVGQQIPQLKEVIIEVTNASRQCFKDLLVTYDTRNPNVYLPDIEAILNAGPPAGGPAQPLGAPGQPGVASGEPSVPPAASGTTIQMAGLAPPGMQGGGAPPNM